MTNADWDNKIKKIHEILKFCNVININLTKTNQFQFFQLF